MQHFIIRTKLPGLNEVLAWKRVVLQTKGKHKAGVLDLYAKKKRELEGLLALQLRAAGVRGTVTDPVFETIAFFDTSKRDVDNVPIGVKFVNDALKGLGYFPDDSREWIAGLTVHVLEHSARGVLIATHTSGLTAFEAYELFEKGTKK
jgi:Holliday junction resolvase RusA-like endonuclease